jgi:hypothetical protein
MYYMLTPIERQHDSGFGVVADAFKRAADKLADEKPSKAMLDHLPVSFLYRHTIELYLKSVTVILHRRLKIPYGAEPHTAEPRVLIGKEWLPIFRVHSILDLYQYFRSIYNGNVPKLNHLADVNWELEEDLDAKVKLIEEHDRGSTLFRYPTTKDAVRDRDKSGFREVDPADVQRMMNVAGEYVKAFLVLDKDDNVKHVYVLDNKTGAEVSVALASVAGTFSNLHAALRFAVLEGW